MNNFEYLTEDDMDILATFEEEQSRIGHFTRLFPLASNIDSYAPFFETPRHANLIVWQYLKQGSPKHHIFQHYKA